MEKTNLHILTIGVDQGLLDPSSRSFKRIREYASLVSRYSVFVFTQKNVERIVDGNFEVIPVSDRNKLLQVLRLFVLFKREILKDFEGVRVLSSQDPFEIGLISMLLSTMHHIPFHVQVHTDISSPLFKKDSLRQRLQYFLATFVLKRAKSIRVVSARIEKFLIDHLHIAKTKIVKAPVYIERIETQKVEKQKNLIVSLGRLEKVKNILMLIDSFEIIARLVPDATLAIFGDGEEKTNLEKRIAKSAYKERITLHSSVLNPFEVMAKASVFAISSNFEGYAVTAVESVMSETPVCMTPVGCAEEFIVNCINGFVSPSFSAPDFAETLKRTLEFNFDTMVLKKSVNTLLTREEYFGKLLESWNKAI